MQIKKIMEKIKGQKRVKIIGRKAEKSCPKKATYIYIRI